MVDVISGGISDEKVVGKFSDSRVEAEGALGGTGEDRGLAREGPTVPAP